MSVLDFFLRFKTDVQAGAKKDVVDLEKQIDELAKKGKKHSEEQTKQAEKHKKERKEALDDTKKQQKETDELSDSFNNLVNNAIGAVTAYASFSFLKNSLIDANNLNASLKILQETYRSLNGAQVEHYARTFELLGVKKQDFYNFVQAQAALNQAQGIPFNLDTVIKNLRQRSGTAGFGRFISSTVGGVPLTPGLTASDAAFNAAYEKAGLYSPGQQDLTAALSNKVTAAAAAQAGTKRATEVDTYFSSSVQKFNEGVEKFANLFSGHPVASGIVGGAGSILASLGIWRGLRWGWRGIAGAGAAVSEGAAGVSTGAVAAIAAAAAAATWGASAAGDWLGHKLEGKTPTSNPVQPLPPSSRREQIMDFWKSQGYSSGQAAGWTANAQAESSLGLHLLGYDGAHYGLYQWSNDWRRRILNGTNIDVASAGLSDQLKAAAWAAKTYGYTPDKLPQGAGASAAYLTTHLELPSKGAALQAEAARRAGIAESYGIGSSPTPGKSISIKIDDIIVNTAATDAQGIAREVGHELTNQIRLAIANFDDGINA
ncbi:MAG: hypothetical protein KGL39_23575 [Patescibacteria group bacterium]|nr:hypothetical protein [Patescibacteria group bacterium]